MPLRQARRARAVRRRRQHHPHHHAHHGETAFSKLFSFKSSQSSVSRSGGADRRNDGGGAAGGDNGSVDSAGSSSTFKSILRRNDARERRNTERNVSWSDTFDTYEEGGGGAGYYGDGGGGGGDWEEGGAGAFDPRLHGYGDGYGDAREARQDGGGHARNLVEEGLARDQPPYSYDDDTALFDADDTTATATTTTLFDLDDTFGSVSVSVSEDADGSAVEVERVGPPPPSASTSSELLEGITYDASSSIITKEAPSSSRQMTEERRPLVGPAEDRALPTSRRRFRNLASASTVSEATLEAMTDRYGWMDDDGEEEDVDDDARFAPSHRGGEEASREAPAARKNDAAPAEKETKKHLASVPKNAVAPAPPTSAKEKSKKGFESAAKNGIDTASPDPAPPTQAKGGTKERPVSAVKNSIDSTPPAPAKEESNDSPPRTPAKKEEKKSPEPTIKSIIDSPPLTLYPAEKETKEKDSGPSTPAKKETKKNNLISAVKKMVSPTKKVPKRPEKSAAKEEVATVSESQIAIAKELKSMSSTRDPREKERTQEQKLAPKSQEIVTLETPNLPTTTKPLEEDKGPKQQEDPASKGQAAVPTHAAKSSDFFVPQLLEATPASLSYDESGSTLGSVASMEELDGDFLSEAVNVIMSADGTNLVDVKKSSEDSSFASFEDNPSYDMTRVHAASDDESIVSLTKKEHDYEPLFKKQQTADRSSAGKIGLILPQFLDKAMGNMKVGGAWPSMTMFESWDAEALRSSWANSIPSTLVGSSSGRTSGAMNASLQSDDGTGNEKTEEGTGAEKEVNTAATSSTEGSEQLDNVKSHSIDGSEEDGTAILSKDTSMSQLSVATESYGASMSLDDNVVAPTTLAPSAEKSSSDGIEGTAREKTSHVESCSDEKSEESASSENQGSVSDGDDSPNGNSTGVNSARLSSEEGSINSQDVLAGKGIEVKEQGKLNQLNKKPKKKSKKGKKKKRHKREEEIIVSNRPLPEIVIMDPSVTGSEDVYLNENSEIDIINFSQKASGKQPRLGLWGRKKKKQNSFEASAFSQISEIFHATAPSTNNRVYENISTPEDDTSSQASSCITTESILGELRVIENTAKMMYQQMMMGSESETKACHNNISALFSGGAGHGETELLLGGTASATGGGGVPAGGGGNDHDRRQEEAQQSQQSKEEDASTKTKKKRGFARWLGRLCPNKKRRKGTSWRFGFGLFGAKAMATWTPKDDDSSQNSR